MINPQETLLPVLSNNPDMPISEDYYHDMSLVQGFMLQHTEGGDVLISTVYGLYAAWEGEPRFHAIYRITSQTPKQDVFALVDQNPSGWIVIDQIRLDQCIHDRQGFFGEGPDRIYGLVRRRICMALAASCGKLNHSRGIRKRTMNLSIVISVFNEERSLALLFDEITQAMAPLPHDLGSHLCGRWQHR